MPVHWNRPHRLRPTVSLMMAAPPRCLVAERCCDQVRWAIGEHAWRFERADCVWRDGLMHAIHPNARTTPTVRAEIARSREFEPSAQAIRNWVADCSMPSRSAARSICSSSATAMK